MVILDEPHRFSRDSEDMFACLLSKRYIERNYNIKSENRDKFFEEYPEFKSVVSNDKIFDRNKQKN